MSDKVARIGMKRRTRRDRRKREVTFFPCNLTFFSAVKKLFRAVGMTSDAIIQCSYDVSDV